MEGKYFCYNLKTGVCFFECLSVMIAFRRVDACLMLLCNSEWADPTYKSIEKLFTIESFNSHLQGGIWFGSVALSPIITFPHFTMV